MTASLRNGFLRACALPALALLAGCGPQDSEPAQPATATATPAIALSPELQSIYNRSCIACHGTPSTGAPQAGDRAAWAPRVAKGADVLLEHTLNGFNAMPPMGACMDCSAEQYAALIEYMADTRQKR